MIGNEVRAAGCLPAASSPQLVAAKHIPTLMSSQAYGPECGCFVLHNRGLIGAFKEQIFA